MLRAPESTRQCRGADWVALARTRISGRAAVLANIVVALVIAKDVATWAGGKLRPATFERPFGRGHRGSRRSIMPSGLGHTGSEQQSGENQSNHQDLNSKQSH